MGIERCHLLLCDYEGEFRFSDTLTKLGYLVDHVRPEALKHVSVGDHQVFIFSFLNAENEKKALQTCEKLKQAELPTGIILMHLGEPSTIFRNHKSGKLAADAYVETIDSESPLLDILDKMVGCPFPPALKGSLNLLREDRDRSAQIDLYKGRIRELEKKVMELEGAVSKTDDSLKPKLQELLKGQKLKFQTETERLKIELSEIEAKLMDREVKIIALEELAKSYKKKLRAHAIDDADEG